MNFSAQEKVKEYFHKVYFYFYSPKNLIKFCAGALLGAGLLIMSTYMLDMDFKRFLICFCLSFGTSACIFLPKWEHRINYFLLIFYLLIVPLKVFQRIELCFHDMNKLIAGVKFLSVWLILCIYALVFLAVQRTHLSLAIGNLILLCFLLFAYSVFLYQGLLIAPIDLVVPDLSSLIASWSMTLPSPRIQEFCYSLLYFIFFIALGFRIQIPLKKIKYAKLTLSALSAASILGFYITVAHTSYLDNKGITVHYENMSHNQLRNGTLINYIVFQKERKFYTVWNDTTAWYEKDRWIYHALGETPEGAALTNSLEAFLYNYRQGRRIFEADFQTTSDDQLVLRHDWLCDFGQSDAFGWTDDGEHKVPTAKQFLSVPLYGQYTPLSLEDLFMLMQKYPDVYLVTDTKLYSHETNDFQIIVDTARKMGCESVLDRVIIQLYYPDMYDDVEAVYHFSNYILTIYYIGWTSAEETAGFCAEHGIPVLTMPENYWYGDKCLELEPYNIRVYVHTVNEPERAEALFSNGVAGIYTDNLGY